MSETARKTTLIEDLVWRDAAMDTAASEEWMAWAVDGSVSLDLGDGSVRAKLAPTLGLGLLAAVAVWMMVYVVMTTVFAQLTGLQSGHGEGAVLLATAASAATLYFSSSLFAQRSN